MKIIDSPLAIVIIAEITIVLINAILLKSVIHEKFEMGKHENKDFYVFLPSNVRARIHHAANTIGNFTTSLRRRLKFPLDEKWELGLAELSFTKSWYVLTRDIMVKLFQLDDDLKHPNEYELKTSTVSDPSFIAHGNYESPESLILAANTILKKFEYLKTSHPEITSIPKLKFDKQTMEVVIVPGMYRNGSMLLPKFDDELHEIFGFVELYDGEKLDWMGNEEREKVESIIKMTNSTRRHMVSELRPKRPISLNAGFLNLFVYCDIVEPSFVGDSRTKLLRVIPVPSDAKFGHQCTVHYDRPLYMPLSIREFETIELDIKDATGQTVPFEFGMLLATLHFRQVTDG
jgi:hypothetical protein